MAFYLTIFQSVNICHNQNSHYARAGASQIKEETATLNRVPFFTIPSCRTTFSSAMKSLKYSQTELSLLLPQNKPIINGDRVLSQSTVARIGQNCFLELLNRGMLSMLNCKTRVVTFLEILGLICFASHLPGQSGNIHHCKCLLRVPLSVYQEGSSHLWANQEILILRLKVVLLELLEECKNMLPMFAVLFATD